VGSYWQLPERLYDDPEELTGWARAALAAAQRAALGKRPKVRKAKAAKKIAVKKPAAKKAEKPASKRKLRGKRSQ
jgi:DNA transformation protein